jgi:ribose transport system ATP-binding protein
MEKVLLKFSAIGKHFSGVHALEDVSADLYHGHILGLIGENGAGKSSLMNILGGIVHPDAGSMYLKGQLYDPATPSDAANEGIAFIHQELNLFSNLSVADNVFINTFPKLPFLPFIDKKRVYRRCAELLNLVNLNIPPQTVVGALTPGEQQLVEIAKSFAVGATIFIFDEPTTSLTSRETEKLFQLIKELKSQGNSIIYISHILNDIVQLADDILVLRDGKAVAQGEKTEFTIDSMISAMVGRDLQQYYPVRKSKPQHDKILEVKDLSQEGIIKEINFSLYKGEILGIFGLMGSGRSELARIIFGMDPFETGSIYSDSHLQNKHSPKQRIAAGMAFVTENRREEGLLMDESLLNNIGLVSLKRYANALMIDEKKLFEDVKKCSDRMYIKSEDLIRLQVQNLSGGNQQKVVIAKWLLSNPAVFVLDEPTRGIDVGARYEIYTIMNDLAAHGAGILCISSNLEELMGICDRILVMSFGELVGTVDKSDFNDEEILRIAYREHLS